MLRGGGGIYSEYLTELSLENSSVSGNEATNLGAGIYAVNTWLYIDSCELNENEIIGGQGGAIYYTVGAEENVYGAEIYNTSISDNLGLESANCAGAVFNKPEDFPSYNVYLENCLFDNNISGNAYGGLLISGIDLEFDLINCLFTNNSVPNYTAAAGFTHGSRGELINCLFASNTANTSGEEWNSGGVTLWGGAEVEFYNCTFADNSAYYGQALTLGFSDAMLVNCIIWNNGADQVSLLSNEEAGSTLIVAYCDVENGQESISSHETSELIWEDGNIDDDPLFYGTGDHPYSLDMGSPCIDKGTPDSLGIELPGTDCVGNIRVWDGNNDEIAVVDMGPYEYGSVPVGLEDWTFIDKNKIKVAVFPNPFSSSTNIEYELPQPQTVTLTFYNQFGKQVDRIEQKQSVGVQQVVWSPELPGGFYYFRLEAAGRQISSGKVVLVR